MTTGDGTTGSLGSRPRQMLLRYRYPDGRLQAALPMYVVQDSADVVVGWLPTGTEIMYWATDDGADPRGVPLDERFHRRLGTARQSWRGGGVLRVIPLAQHWQAIHFWDTATAEFASWYVNLESVKRRRGMVLDAVDWHLDLVIDPTMAASWKDEDEAAAALGTPYLLGEDLHLARRTGERIAADPAAWLREVGDWRSFVPQQSWQALALPEDWDA